jgi:hypothetical protein
MLCNVRIMQDVPNITLELSKAVTRTQIVARDPAGDNKSKSVTLYGIKPQDFIRLLPRLVDQLAKESATSR